LTPMNLSARMADRAGAELHELTDVGHMSLLEAGEEISAVLDDLLQGRAPVASAPQRAG
jgi:pimeloyl-ACP methyl ester carboxylesterase